jgi:hypothetical protein
MRERAAGGVRRSLQTESYAASIAVAVEESIVWQLIFFGVLLCGFAMRFGRF